MQDIREKGFEYYENRASYFAYTHTADEYDSGVSEEYIDQLSKGFFEKRSLKTKAEKEV